VRIWLYAGKPEYPALPRDVRQDVYHGDNVAGAENQQERLIEFRGWVIGFVDGRGMLLDRSGAATEPAGPKRLQNRIPGLTRLRGRAGRLQRYVPPRAA
jgi:hypothetical protein